MRILTPTALLLAAFGASLASVAHGQSSPQFRAPRMPVKRPRVVLAPADGPNRGGEADAAARDLVDSIFKPKAPNDPLTSAAASAMGVPKTKAAPSSWTGRLVRTPKQANGQPPYAIIDQYGGILRYVEPVPQVDLERSVGQVVTVRRDTGGTLLATQLDLPRVAPRTAGVVQPWQKKSAAGVRLAQAQEPLVPEPATDALHSVAKSAEPLPAGSPEAGETIDEGQMVEGEGPMLESGMPMEGQIYDEQGRPITNYSGMEPLYLDDGLNFGGCPTCGDKICGGRGCALGGCGFGSRPIWYARGEYLLWQFKGMDTPPLVVRGEVNDNDTPTVPTDDFFDNATVVYGGKGILTSARSGYRIKLGYWLDDCGKWAIEGDYFGFGRVNDTFTDGGNGTTPIVGRPFIDATTGLDAVEDVSFPGIMGTVTVDSFSRFQSAGVHLRKNLCCVSTCDTNCGDCVTCGSTVGSGGCAGCDAALLGLPCMTWFRGGTRHVDVLYGFRWAELNEGLSVNEDLETIAPSTPVGTTIVLNDRFRTNNTFLGGEVGFVWEWEKQRWSLEVLSKLAVGSTQQKVSISGDTTNTDPGQPPETKQGGLLTQNSNIGDYSRDVFSVMPEIGFTGGYLLTDRLRLTAGYTLFYWSRVARPGDQIDLEVNPGKLGFPPTTDPPNRPAFVFRDTDLWAHGLNAGLDYRW